ncbi:rhodanese-like domain-containing protein [Acidobacteria bacterium AH-259-O06]|nr:rhodanese-like domain-containing protein [Acidobacteria bacterium AH-259-O06]
MARRLAVIVVATFIIALTLATRAAAEEALAQENKTERMAISELKKKLDSGEEFLLIDVREDWELDEDGAIPGAIHIPVAELDKRMKDIPKDVELVFY